MRVNRNVRSWWRRFIGHLGTLLLSIIMGLIVWLIAINQQNPLVTQPYNEALPIEVRGLAADLAPARTLALSPVQLELQAPRTSWDRLRRNAISVYVDLSELREGTHEVPIAVSIADPEVVVVEQTPSTLEIQLDKIITRTLPVEAVVTGNAGDGYNYEAGTAVTNPAEVTISGPASQVAQVAAARTNIFLNGEQGQVTRPQTVELLGTQNNTVKVRPSTVQVSVPLQPWRNRKQVPVRVNLVGSPAEGYRLLGLPQVEPSMVTLVLEGEDNSSNRALLNSIGLVETEPYTITGATGEMRARLNLNIDRDVLYVAEGTTVDVVVNVVPVENSDRITLKPIVRGLGPNLVATPTVSTVEVIVTAPQRILDALELDDVFVILDLTNRLQGTHVIIPQVVYPDDIRLDGVWPETVEVVVSPAITPTLGLTDTATVTSTTTVTPAETLTTAAELTATAPLTASSTVTETVPLTVTRTQRQPAARTATPEEE